MSKKQTNILGIPDVPFLLFLLGITYVKMSVKIAVLLLYVFYVFIKRYPFVRPNKINLFYAVMILLALVGTWFNGTYHIPNYKSGFTIGIIQWGIAMSASYLLYITARVKTHLEVRKVLKWYFAINGLVSVAMLISIVLKLHFHFPYWSHDPVYGISTGDYIRGSLNDVSIANAAVNTIGAIYFLKIKQFRWAFFCTIIMLLCTSNITLIFFIVILIAMVFLAKDLAVKRNAIFMMLLSGVLYFALSPENIKYISAVYQRDVKQDSRVKSDKLSDAKKTPVAATPKASKTKPAYSEDEFADVRNKHMGVVQKTNSYYAYRAIRRDPVLWENTYYRNVENYEARLKDNTTAVDGESYVLVPDEPSILDEGEEEGLDPYIIRAALAKWYEDSANVAYLESHPMPGKLYTYYQTAYFLNSNYRNLIFGAGLGNFSSKVAIKMTGLGIQGNYAEEKVYINNNFVQYHLYTMLYYLSKHVAEHSVINFPNSTYNQLGGEYGLLGILVFLFFYIGFLWKSRKKLNAGILISLLLLLFFGVEYWFEVLSVTVIFELLIFSELFAVDNNE